MNRWTNFRVLPICLLGVGVMAGGVAAAQMGAGAGGGPAASTEEMQRMMQERQGGGMMDMMGGGRGGMGMRGGRHDAMDDGMMGMMGGMGPFGALDLSDDQRGKLRKLADELRRKNWDAQGKVLDEESKLRDLYDADKRDPKAIGAVYGAIFILKRQMIEATIDTHNRMEALLTPAQRDELKQLRRGGMMGDAPGGMGMGRGGMMGR